MRGRKEDERQEESKEREREEDEDEDEDEDEQDLLLPHSREELGVLVASRERLDGDEVVGHATDRSTSDSSNLKTSQLEEGR